jgi:3-hydroxyisobutyrate dehydrogenase-like beta-hydroxyacid dehydrogenase
MTEQAPIPQPVGLIGLGTMGSRYAARLIERGFDLVVYDSAQEARAACASRGARASTSPRDVADLADVVLVSLPSPEAVYEVCCGEDGLVGGSRIRTYVDLSTTGATMAEQVAATLATRNVRCVDAPVSGGPAAAEAGTLTIMIAGDEEVLAEVKLLLETIGSNVFVVGTRPGQAQLVKLINNLLSATAIAITGEALVLAAKADLDPGVVLDVVNVSSGASKATADKFPNQVLTRAFNHGFRLDLMAKDVRLCVGEASRYEVPMLLAGTVDQLWRMAEGQLEDGVDCTAIVRLLERWADTTIARTTENTSTGWPQVASRPAAALQLSQKPAIR